MTPRRVLADRVHNRVQRGKAGDQKGVMNADLLQVLVLENSNLSLKHPWKVL